MFVFLAEIQLNYKMPPNNSDVNKIVVCVYLYTYTCTQSQKKAVQSWTQHHLGPSCSILLLHYFQNKTSALWSKMPAAIRSGFQAAGRREEKEGRGPSLNDRSWKSLSHLCFCPLTRT